MAKNKSTVYLGFDDEEISAKYSQLNSTVNKIGGHPDWPNGDIKVSACAICGLTRPLIVQLYAPLEHSQFHRTLFIFACLNPSCSQNSKSWTCIRTQYENFELPDLVVNSGSKKKKNVKQTAKVNVQKISWHPGADDWGRCEDDIEEMDTGKDDFQLKGSQNEENGNANVEIDEDDDDDDESNSMENEVACALGNLDIQACQPNSMEDANANCASGVAVPPEGDANVFGAAVTSFAEIEGGENDVVLVETPKKPERDLIALLKPTPKALEPLNKLTDVTLKSYFISVDIEQNVREEYEQYEGSLSSDHIREIYQEYKRRDEEKLSPNGLNKAVVAGVVDVESPESYEKALPAHGDVVFHRFLVTVQRNPGQILRYTRDALPLLIAPLCEPVPKCPNCNGDTLCEVQILSTLIPKLRLQQTDENAPLEYGNVLVFTCLKSCWDTPDKMRHERVVVQQEK